MPRENSRTSASGQDEDDLLDDLLGPLEMNMEAGSSLEQGGAASDWEERALRRMEEISAARRRPFQEPG